MDNYDNYTTRYQIGFILLSENDVKINSIVNEVLVDDEKYLPNIKGIGSCRIDVYGGEGDIPHFHITGENGKFKTCIKIYSAEYFKHGTKQGELSNKGARELNDWLQSENKIAANGNTNWEVIRLMWELSNPNCRFPESKKVKKQPNYTTLND